MNEDFRSAQRHIRRIWFLLVFLLLLVLIGIILTLLKPAPKPVINNYVGQRGAAGNSVQGPKGDPGYTPIKGIDYINGKDGVNGTNGKDGIPGTDGTNGTNGIDGATGLTPEIECLNGDFVTRYPGDDSWRVLQKDSLACKGKP